MKRKEIEKLLSKNLSPQQRRADAQKNLLRLAKQQAKGRQQPRIAPKLGRR